jgi:hypothetical protein
MATGWYVKNKFLDGMLYKTGIRDESITGVAAVKFSFAASLRKGLKAEVMVTIFGADVSTDPSLDNSKTGSLPCTSFCGVAFCDTAFFFFCACTDAEAKNITAIKNILSKCFMCDLL